MACNQESSGSLKIIVPTIEIDSVTEENRRQSSISFKNGDNKEAAEPNSPSTKVPKKFINNWRQACDRTKDRTKELLKKWRTMPDTGSAPAEESVTQTSDNGSDNNNTNWSEHVWTTWVKRSMSEEESKSVVEMTEIQRKKFNHFFISYLDLDRDDFISIADFDAFTERLRHFSDWSKNSTEYHRLREVQRGFIETFLLSQDQQGIIQSDEVLEKKIKKEQLSLEQWLGKWNLVLNQCKNFYELPLWLQYLPKILFQAINRSGTGKITKEELSSFFSSLLSLNSVQIGSFVDEAYANLTSNNQHPLTYSVYRLSYANFIFARYPNGPGQYIFGPMAGMTDCCFPVDYRMLNCAPRELEQYSPKLKTNRTSIIV